MPSARPSAHALDLAGAEGFAAPLNDLLQEGFATDGQALVKNPAIISLNCSLLRCLLRKLERERVCGQDRHSAVT